MRPQVAFDNTDRFNGRAINSSRFEGVASNGMNGLRANGIRAEAGSVKRVLIAFGDPESRRQVSRWVARQGEAAALECDCQDSCKDLLGEQRINALLVDTALPGRSANEFCADLRSDRFRPPILLFGPCREDSTAIEALEAGATDYIAMPINPTVFMARLRAHLRQHDESDFVAYRFGPFDFEPGNRLLHDRELGRKIHLTAIETKLVRHLLHQPGAFADRDDLMVALWGASNGKTSHAIDSHVYRVRQKIEPDPKAPVRLVTEGRNYRLVL